MDGGQTDAVFPLFLRTAGATALVVGAGRIAAHKCDQLRGCGFAVEQCGVEDYPSRRLERYALAVAATGERGFNRRMAADCRALHLPVNVVDDPALCTFYFGATAHKAPFTVAVSTGGICPVAGQYLRDQITPLLTDRLSAAAARLGAERERWKAAWPDPAERAAAMRKELTP